MMCHLIELPLPFAAEMLLFTLNSRAQTQIVMDSCCAKQLEMSSIYGFEDSLLYKKDFTLF